MDKKIKCHQQSIDVGTIQGLRPSDKEKIPELSNPLRDHNNTANFQAKITKQNNILFKAKPCDK